MSRPAYLGTQICAAGQQECAARCEQSSSTEHRLRNSRSLESSRGVGWGYTRQGVRRGSPPEVAVFFKNYHFAPRRLRRVAA